MISDVSQIIQHLLESILGAHSIYNYVATYCTLPTFNYLSIKVVSFDIYTSNRIHLYFDPLTFQVRGQILPTTGNVGNYISVFEKMLPTWIAKLAVLVEHPVSKRKGVSLNAQNTPK